MANDEYVRTNNISFNNNIIALDLIVLENPVISKERHLCFLLSPRRQLVNTLLP